MTAWSPVSSRQGLQSTPFPGPSSYGLQPRKHPSGCADPHIQSVGFQTNAHQGKTCAASSRLAYRDPLVYYRFPKSTGQESTPPDPRVHRQRFPRPSREKVPGSGKRSPPKAPTQGLPDGGPIIRNPLISSSGGDRNLSIYSPPRRAGRPIPLAVLC